MKSGPHSRSLHLIRVVLIVKVWPDTFRTFIVSIPLISAAGSAIPPADMSTIKFKVSAPAPPVNVSEDVRVLFAAVLSSIVPRNVSSPAPPTRLSDPVVAKRTTLSELL